VKLADQLKTASASRDEAVAKYDDLVGKYNDLAKKRS